MGLWDSIVVVAIFSVLVIAADEWLHARRRERRQRRTKGVLLTLHRGMQRSRAAGLRGR